MFVWSPVMKLESVSESERYVFLHFGDRRVQMSKGAYGSSATEARARAHALVGKNVKYRTSQNTAKWPADVWWSDVEAATEAEAKAPGLIDKIKGWFK